VSNHGFDPEAWFDADPTDSFSASDASSCGYVGLVNQGATCYMNSLMQQLFMVPQFRYGILAQRCTDAADAGDDDAAAAAAAAAATTTAAAAGADVAGGAVAVAVAPAHSPPLDDNRLLLYQLQRVFAHLQHSAKRAFDAVEFCAAYK
jgi:hypothetical protein